MRFLDSVKEERLVVTKSETDVLAGNNRVASCAYKFTLYKMVGITSVALDCEGESAWGWGLDRSGLARMRSLR